MAVQAPLSLSWVGSSCLCPQDAERELIALREQAILQRGVLKSTKRSGGAEKASGEPYRWRRSSRSPSRRSSHPPSRRFSHPPSNTTTLLEKKSSTPPRKLTSDEAVVKIQEETEALRQALADKSDYRLAQCSMNRLDGLENALWEAHAAEVRAAAQLETLELQQEQKIEEEALEADLKQRIDRLREACGKRAFTLRRDHALQLDKLDRAARSGSGGGGGSGGASATTPGLSAPAQFEQVPIASTPSLASIHQHQTKWKTDPNDTIAEEQEQEEREHEQEKEEQQERQEQERGEEGESKNSVRQPAPLVAVAVAKASVPVPVMVPVLVPGVGAGTGAVDHARRKEMVDLRDELGRHLAVAHADGGQHLKEATIVMRLIEEVEAQARLQAEVKATSKHDSLEKISLRQKHAQAEDVQQEKHEKLLRTLQRSRAEQLRLVSARHNSALGRLTERRREKNRRRKHELRDRLATAKGGVARTWKEHNRSLLDAGRASEKRRAARDNGESLEKREPTAAAEAAAAPIEAAAVPERGFALTSMVLAASKRERGGDRGATHSSCLVESTAAAAATAVAEAAVGEEKQAKADASKRLTENTRPSIVVEQVLSWDTSVQTKQKPRRARTLSPAATTTFPRGSRSNNGVPARRQQRKCRVISNTHDDDAPELLTTSPTLTTAFVSGAVGILSEEEVQALAALGRGTPNDPRLLLVASRPPSPSEAEFVEVPREKRDVLRAARDDDVKSSYHKPRTARDHHGNNNSYHKLPTPRDDYGKNSYHTLRTARDDCGKDSYHSDGGGHAVGTIRGRGSSVLERAVDKLVPEMRAREELTRRIFGMASLASW